MLLFLPIISFSYIEFYRERVLTSQKWTTQFNPIASVAPLLTTGTLCFAQRQYQQALVHFNQALKIQQRYLLPNNPEFFTTFNCIADAYYEQDRFDQALYYHEKALHIQQRSPSPEGSSLASSYFDISKDYIGLSQ